VGLLFALGPQALAVQDNALTFQPQALDYTGVYYLRQLDPTLTGAGISVGLVCRSITYTDGWPQGDYRPNVAHNCLRHTQFTFLDNETGPRPPSAHATAIASILFGYDPSGYDPVLGPFSYQGVVPEAKATTIEFWKFVLEYVFANTAPQVDVLTMSIGSQFSDWWTRGVQAMAERHGLVVVAGVGNGSHAYDPVLYPAGGANVIAVGVIDSVSSNELPVILAYFALPRPAHSSCGPTSDGRAKPDLVAPGNCLAADVNRPGSYQPTGDWSSFSTPIVAGAAALLVQEAKRQPALGSAISPQAGNCVIKAILLNSARKLPFWHKGAVTRQDDHYVPLDYLQGAGALDALAAYRQLTAGQAAPGPVSPRGWDRNRLAAAARTSQNTYTIKLAPNTNQFIVATLVWNKHFSYVYPFEPLPEKDTDLRLELWAVDSATPQQKYLLDYSDSPVDNVEHIYCAADPNYTDYEIVVSFNSPDEVANADKTQLYALAWNIAQPPETNSIFWYDLNADGIVDGTDLTILLKYIADSSGAQAAAASGDINNDGSIDLQDLRTLASKMMLSAEWHRAKTSAE
jgi:hypothetical protein